MDAATVLQMYTPAVGIVLPLIIAVRIYWFSFIITDIAFGWKWTQKGNRWLMPTKGLKYLGHPVLAFLIRHSLLLCAHVAVALAVGTTISLFTSWSWWYIVMFSVVGALAVAVPTHRLWWAAVSKKYLHVPLPVEFAILNLREDQQGLASDVRWGAWQVPSWLADVAHRPEDFPEEQVTAVMERTVALYRGTSDPSSRLEFTSRVLELLTLATRQDDFASERNVAYAQRAVALIPDEWLQENIWQGDLITFLPVLIARKNGWKIALNSSHAKDRLTERASVLDAHNEAVTAWLEEHHPSLMGMPSEWVLEALDGEFVAATPEEDVWGSHVPERSA